MEIRPNLVDKQIGPNKTKKVYGQWVSIFNVLRKNNTHKEAIDLLSQYNALWSKDTNFIPVEENEIGVPEYGMLKALDYSVSFSSPEYQQDNIDANRRQDLLKHIFANECPPLHSATYRDKWGAPASLKRINKLISVLENLTGGLSANYPRNEKPVARWSQDLEELKTFRLQQFPDFVT